MRRLKRQLLRQADGAQQAPKSRLVQCLCEEILFGSRSALRLSPHPSTAHSIGGLQLFDVNSDLMEIQGEQRPDLWPSKFGWKKYEAYVLGSLQRLCPGADFRRNAYIKGRKSGKLRQIDILMERELGGFGFKVAIDCKCYKRKVTVNDVDRFLGMLDDVRVSKGVLITTKGYSSAAQHRAQHESRDMELRILTPERLSEFQHIGDAFPWHEPVGAVVSTPEGWVVDNQPTASTQFAMYPLGHTRDSAARRGAFLYGNILLKDPETPTMEAIAEKHERDILDKVPAAKFERLSPIARTSASDSEPEQTLFRVGYIHPSYGGPEYSLYIDHPKGVLLLVLLCPQGEEQTHVPVLKWIGAKVLMTDCVDTRRERTREVHGRISVYLNRAKHVEVYERDAPSVPWSKVREFVEIIEPFRTLPQPRNAISDQTLLLESCEFQTVVIPTDGLARREIPGEGWAIPLWDPAGLTPKPRILLRFRGLDERAEINDPQHLSFFASTRFATTPGAWPPVQGVDVEAVTRPR
jgi:Restriction endonuclease